MKLIDLTPLPDCPASAAPRTILTAVAALPQDGANLEQVRRRLRVLEALEAQQGNTLLLEDADHSTLCEAVRTFRFSAANKFIVHACDAALNAKAPEAASE